MTIDEEFAELTRQCNHWIVRRVQYAQNMADYGTGNPGGIEPVLWPIGHPLFPGQPGEVTDHIGAIVSSVLSDNEILFNRLAPRMTPEEFRQLTAAIRAAATGNKIHNAETSTFRVGA